METQKSGFELPIDQEGYHFKHPYQFVIHAFPPSPHSQIQRQTTKRISYHISSNL